MEGEVNPVRDLEIISEELRLKDMQYLAKNIVSIICSLALYPGLIMCSLALYPGLLHIMCSLALSLDLFPHHVFFFFDI